MKPYYQNENVTLYHGDCLEVMPDLTMTFDACITDPPYGTTACKWDTVIPFEPMWENLKRLIKKSGAICLFGSEPFSSMLRVSNLSGFKYDWVWVKNKKTGFLNAKKQPLRQVEDVVIFYHTQPTYNPQKTQGHKPVNSFIKHTSDGDTMGKTKIGIADGGQTDRYPANVLTIPVVNNDNSNGDKYHPTQKPVALIEYLIKTYTNEGESVLDFTSGSGTTGVACMNLKRNCVLIEMEERYCEITANRLQSTERELAERLF